MNYLFGDTGIAYFTTGPYLHYKYISWVKPHGSRVCLIIYSDSWVKEHGHDYRRLITGIYLYSWMGVQTRKQQVWEKTHCINMERHMEILYHYGWYISLLIYYD